MKTQKKVPIREKIRIILGYMRGYKRYFGAVLLFAMAQMLFNALLPQVVKIAVDGALGTGEVKLPGLAARFFTVAELRAQPYRWLWLSAAMVAGLAILRGVAMYGQRVSLAKGSEGFVKTIRDDLYRHIQYLDFQWHTAHPTGDIIQRCTSDVETIRMFVCNQLMDVVRTVFLIGLYMGFMLAMNVRLALVSFCFVPLVSIFSGVFYQKISHRFKDADEAEGVLVTCAQENLTGVRVVRAFGRERYEVDRFEEKNKRFSFLWIKLGQLLSLYWASGTLLTCIQVMVVILIGVTEAVNGSLSLGDFLAFVTYNTALSWPVRNLGRVLANMSKAGVAMDRVGDILASPEETDGEDAREDVPAGDIVFDHVTFGYEGQEVLRDVSFTIPAGSAFAILGGTGSGKSTLVHLLDRLYDLGEGQGRITIGGVDIRDIRRGALRRHIGLVLQEPFLFSQTIRENIAAVRPDADQEEIRRAARIACVDEAIAEFKDGYDTLVGERGVTLSGGQKQRIAIARMLLQKAPVMVFDDSLSAVDAETDAKIRGALLAEGEGRTLILISHRVTTLMQCDRILVLDKGRVADMGSHAQLISRPGIYKEIYDIQMSRDDRRLLEEGGEE